MVNGRAPPVCLHCALFSECKHTRTHTPNSIPRKRIGSQIRSVGLIKTVVYFVPSRFLFSPNPTLHFPPDLRFGAKIIPAHASETGNTFFPLNSQCGKGAKMYKKILQILLTR